MICIEWETILLIKVLAVLILQNTQIAMQHTNAHSKNVFRYPVIKYLHFIRGKSILYIKNGFGQVNNKSSKNW